MTSVSVKCPECGTHNRKHGGASRRRKDEENHECNDCGAPLPCPVCQPDQYPDKDDDGDNCGPGYFRGDSTGDCLACPFCNHDELVRQRRSGRRA